MSNMEKYQDILCEVLQVSREECLIASTQTVALWDSVGKLSLVAALEEEFSIEMEPQDILQFNSYEDGIKIFNKYGIQM